MTDLVELPSAHGMSARAVRRQSNQEVLLALAAVAPLLVLTYPILALPYACALLINGPVYMSRRARHLLGLSAALALALLLSQRPYGGPSDDLASYYAVVYRGLAEGDWSQFTAFAGGVEIGLPIVLWLGTVLLPPLSPTGLMLVLAIVSALLLWFWIERSFYRGKDAAERAPLLLGVAVLMFNVSYSTQVVRQFLSLIILLYAFTAQTRRSAFIFLCLATAFHTTAIPFYLAFLAGRRGFIGLLFVVVSALAIRFWFHALLDSLQLLPPILTEKLSYYVDNNQSYTDSDLGSLKLVIQLCLISAVSFIWAGFRVPKGTGRWHVVPWVTAIVHVSLLSIPLASLRTTLMVHSVATGVIAKRLIPSRQRLLLLLVFNAVLVYKVIGYFSLVGSPAEMSTLEILLHSVDFQN